MALGSPEAARHAAHAILAESRFHDSPVPNPLHGVLVWIGRAITDPIGALGNLLGRISSSFPGGVGLFWVVVAALILVAAGLLARRHAGRLLERPDTAPNAVGPRPGTLERAAAEAEREGKWAQAVRLRFRAGLLRLNEVDGIREAETIPNRSLARMLGSKSLEELGARFDEIVYGGAEATATDAERQRSGWPEIIAGSRR